MITLMGKLGQDLFLFLLAEFSVEVLFFQLFHELGGYGIADAEAALQKKADICLCSLARYMAAR